MDFTGIAVSRGLFAPSIHFHNGLFYITCTMVDGGGNFVVTAKDPAGPWSMPVWLPEINGIDPSLFFDKDKAWIIYNSEAPDHRPLYKGHRTIRIRSFDPIGLSVGDEERTLVNGGTNLELQPRWIEGPHIFYNQGFYYLVAAEGGTGTDHAVVAFRTRSLEEPFTSCTSNPLLTHRLLPADRLHPITSTGHAQLLETKEGKWHAVLLACRPYEADHYNTGRETFLVPVSWEDGWPRLHTGNGEISYTYPLPFPGQALVKNHYSGNFSFIDRFTGPELSSDWMMLRTPKIKWYELLHGGGLLMKLQPFTLSGRQQPSFIARRQQHKNCQAILAMNFDPIDENEKAGLAWFQDEDHFYFLALSIKEEKEKIRLFKSRLLPRQEGQMDMITEINIERRKGQTIYLKLEIKEAMAAFYMALEARQLAASKR
jgi:xylan 1,4-beta-xylosidase